MSETKICADFWREIRETKKEIKRLLKTDDGEEAREIAVLSIRKLLKILPNIEEFHKENATTALLQLVNWQGRDILPEVSESMNVVFCGNLPESVSVCIKKLKHNHDDFLLRKTKREKNGKQDD